MSIAFLDECTALLAHTPAAFDALLRGLPEVWTEAADDSNWSPYVVIGHLIHAEKADWMPRLAIILEHGPARPFDPFDREAQFRDSQGKTLAAQLDEFSALRRENLDRLQALNLRSEQLDLQGTHPALGLVTIRQLLATWTAHDLSHLIQVSRIMARRYKQEVGPWSAFLSVMG